MSIVNEIEDSIYRFTDICKEHLQENVIGIYLHGSAAMNCFNPKRSDYDFIVVISEQPLQETIREFANTLLAFDDQLKNENGIELSVVLQQSLTPFQYPTPVVFHYSKFHRERYRNDTNYMCGQYEDNDFASQMMVAQRRGRCLNGVPILQITEPISREIHSESIYHDVKDAIHDVCDNPVYIVLNLCRVLYFLEEDIIASKKEGGEWGIGKFVDYKVLISQCLDVYSGKSDEQAFNKDQLHAFVKMALGKINAILNK